MALEADLLLDRRRLKRRLALWRAAAVLLLVAGIGAVVAGRTGMEAPGLGRGHVVRLSVNGFIGDDARLIRAVDRLARDTSARALIVAIDSPGGSVGGGEALHAALSRLRATKPVVAVLRGTAASAGYMVAVAAERVWAREGTVTGSIGVLLQSPDLSEALDRLGIRVETIASGPLKDQPSPFRPLTPAGRVALEAVVTDLQDQFVGRVASGRGMAPEAVRAVADGRVLTGRQAQAVGLVDAMGGEAEARAWLAAEKQVPASLPTEELEPRGRVERLLDASLGGVFKSLISEWLGVDPMGGLWQLR